MAWYQSVFQALEWLGLDPIINDCVFVTFKDNLFPCSQLCNLQDPRLNRP